MRPLSSGRERKEDSPFHTQSPQQKEAGPRSSEPREGAQAEGGRLLLCGVGEQASRRSGAGHSGAGQRQRHRQKPRGLGLQAGGAWDGDDLHVLRENGLERLVPVDHGTKYQWLGGKEEERK